jgi:hypothetical protein
VSDVAIEVHPEVETLLSVSWTQEVDASSAQVEYALDGEPWRSTPARAVPAGPASELLLGLPADAEVRVRFAQQIDGEDMVADESWTGSTGSLPEDLPVPTLVAWDPELAAPEPYLLLTVGLSDWYAGPWWLLILDRQARVVWYRALPVGETTVMSRVSADGTHVTWGEADWFETERSVIQRSTLDDAWSETVPAPGMAYTYDELPDGTLAYDAWDDQWVGLRTLAPDGTRTEVWDCLAWLPEDRERWNCGTNTVLWSPARGTYTWSLYDLDTVLEVDPTRGVVGSWGDDGLDPIDAGLQLQHYPNWTAAGTLLLHTQDDGEKEVQWAREFAWDESTNALSEVWSYEADDRYADCSGEAVRLANGNTLINYGCGQAVREIAPDGITTWELNTGCLVGHQTLIADLYALNRGPAGG